MRFARTALAPIAVFVLLATAACGPETADDSPVVVENAKVLHYAYQPGDSLAYEVNQGVSLAMEGGGGAAMSAMDVTMDMSISTLLDYEFAEGPSPDLTEVTISTTLVGGGATMTSMGRTQTIPLTDLAGDLTPTMVLLIDPQGRLVEASVDGQVLPTELLNSFDSMIGQSASQPQHIGPEFPADPIGVGSTWETEQSIDMFGLAITQRGEHAVVAEEEIDGRSTLRIDSTIRTGATRVDVMDVLQEMIASGMAEESGLSENDLELTMAMFDSMDIDFVMRLDDSRTDMSTWFDPVDGIVVKSVMSGPMSMSMSMRGVPQTGDVDLTMDMTIEQTMKLADPSASAQQGDRS
jgi:hypothetical protein